jgi:hypothetical protein
MTPEPQEGGAEISTTDFRVLCITFCNAVEDAGGEEMTFGDTEREPKLEGSFERMFGKGMMRST